MRKRISLLAAVLMLALMMSFGSVPAFAQADNYKNVINQDTTVLVGGEPVEGERRVSSHQVKTPSDNTNSQLDVHESYENGYTFHSHSNLHNGEVKNTFVKG